MDILLTGASGFLGRNFILHCPGTWNVLALYSNDGTFPEFVAAANKPNVTAASCDLQQPEQVRALFDTHGCDWDCCLYLAAKVDIPWSVREPREDLLWNTGSLLNVLAGLRARKFVYFSSGAVYDGLHGEVHPDACIDPTLPYAISKLACERYVSFYNQRQRSIENALIVRFFGAYGPYEAPHKIYTRLIRAFAVERTETYSMYGDGRNLIDAMYIDDAVEAVHHMITGDHWNDTINLAAGDRRTIEELVRESAAALGVSSVNIQKHGIAHESNDFWGSTREMETIYGFRPRTTLADGIVRFRDFLLSHDASETPLMTSAAAGQSIDITRESPREHR
jgi:nucleoside-diphosphate-sugar epimerase